MCNLYNDYNVCLKDSMCGIKYDPECVTNKPIPICKSLMIEERFFQTSVMQRKNVKDLKQRKIVLLFVRFIFSTFRQN